MMSLVPGLRHRIAGKTVHLEKFVELRSYLFFNENETMLLPILDMFYLWNVFPMLQHNHSLIQPFLKDINDNLEIYTPESPDESRHRYYYLVFYRGLCLRYLGQHEEAISCFRQIIASESDIKEYTHLPPHAALELGLVYRKLDDTEEAKVWLNKAVYQYTNYMNATTVHIRAHTALTIIRLAEEPAIDVETQYLKMQERLKQMNSDGVSIESPPEEVKLDPSLEVEDLS
jgi:tetratricopeptide (TPR) repeat protein